MNARVALLEAFGAPLALKEIEIPSLESGQMLVRILAAGVCGSDVHMWQGRDPRTVLPMILGHEGYGEIVDVAGERTDVDGVALQPGDRVLWNRGVSCGRCFYCIVAKQPALCPHRWVYGISRSIREPTYVNGCYGSHIVLDARTAIVRAAEGIDPAVLVAASCSGATAAHAFELTPVSIGDTVLVFGPGPLGAYAVALARAGGARHVVLVGGTARRLALCTRVGATAVLSRHELNLDQRREAVMDLTHGRGADLTVEASGSVAAMQEALDCTRSGGALALVGFGTPVGEVTVAPFEQIVRKNVRVQGVWVSDTRHLRQAISLVESAPDDFAQLVTHRFALDQATAALKAVRDRDALKAVLVP